MRSPECSCQLARMLRSLHDRTGLSHNDLHCNNILIAPATGQLTIIDYEYALASVSSPSLALPSPTVSLSSYLRPPFP